SARSAARSCAPSCVSGCSTNDERRATRRGMSAPLRVSGLPRIGVYPLPEAHELPAARGPWRVRARRAALLIHDMQRYFVAALTPDEPPIEPVIGNIERLAARCRALGVPVFYTCQEGDQDPRDRGLQRDLWGPGMTSSPEHRTVVERLRPLPGDIVLTKHRYS